MKMREIINLIEGIRPPVTYEQVVTPQWIKEVLEKGFDVGLPHAESSYKNDTSFDTHSRSHMLDDLQDEGIIPLNINLNDMDAVFPYIKKWFKLRFQYIIRNIDAVRIGNGYRIGREIRISRQSAETLAANDIPLGNFWSFKSGEAFWGDDKMPSVFLEAIVLRNNIDWITTIRRNMNYTLGEDEQEVFLQSETPIRLLSINIEEDGKWISLPINHSNRKA